MQIIRHGGYYHNPSRYKVVGGDVAVELIEELHNYAHAFIALISSWKEYNDDKTHMEIWEVRGCVNLHIKSRLDDGKTVELWYNTVDRKGIVLYRGSLCTYNDWKEMRGVE